MTLTRRIVVMTLLVALAVMAVALMPGCFGGDGDGGGQQEEYQKGYQDGVKAERAKWSEDKLELARTMIEEQEASQESINRLLKGELAGVTVDEVTVNGDSAQVKITANFNDGTSLPGTVDLVMIENRWYMEKVTAEQGSTPS